MSNSRTPPQEGAASHYYERADNTARRETTVGESSQSTRSKTPVPRNLAARAMRARNDNSNTRRTNTRAQPQKNHPSKIAKRESRGSKTLWQVQGSALAAGGPP